LQMPLSRCGMAWLQITSVLCSWKLRDFTFLNWLQFFQGLNDCPY